MKNVKYRRIKEDLEYTCRECLNRKYSVKLKPKNCVYGEYPHICRECGEVRNIVDDIKFIKRIFL